jgi:hypothetical protein
MTHMCHSRPLLLPESDRERQERRAAEARHAERDDPGDGRAVREEGDDDEGRREQKREDVVGRAGPESAVEGGEDDATLVRGSSWASSRPVDASPQPNGQDRAVATSSPNRRGAAARNEPERSEWGIDV